METNIEEIEKATKELNQIEKLILDNHTKETAKELNNFIKTKQKVAMLSVRKKQNKLNEDLLSPIMKNDMNAEKQ